MSVLPGAWPHAWVNRKGIVLQSQQNTEEAINQYMDTEDFILRIPAKGKCSLQRGMGICEGKNVILGFSKISTLGDFQNTAG